MGDVLEYPDVLQEVRGAMNPGRLKLQSSGVIFRNNKTGRVDQYGADDIRKARWIQRARGHCLKLKLISGAIHRYDGFRDTEYDKLSEFVEKNYEVSLEKLEKAVKGWNWGATEFDGNGLEFKVNEHSAFEVPLGNVSHCATAKNEVTLEFHQNDDAPVSLMEMRFHIPTDRDLVTDENNEGPVVEFYNQVMEKADIIQATGEAIALFSEVYCLTPRGRYDIKLYPSFLQLHGKTFDYKIPYTTILRLFLLPHRDGRQMFFVISLDPPIKQGQTRYHFLILLFNKDDETTLEVGLSEEDIQEKYEGKLQKEMSGLEYEIISRLMKTLVNRKITVPGSFVGKSGSNSVGCSYKAATGFLYPLERGFIFVHKPPIHIRFDEVSSVNFARSSGNTRSFDFDVDTKAGTTFTFVGIDKDEYSNLYDFVKNKKIRIQNVGGKGDEQGAYDDLLDSDDDGGHDAYLQRVKREGRQRNEGDEEDDDESDDEDYMLPDDFSEVDEEFDTDAQSSSSSDDDSATGSDAERRKKEKKEKKKKRTITIAEPSLDGADSDYEAPKKEKKEKGERKKKSKKDVDPNKPKRPMTAYFLWFNENRANIKEEHPDLSITELSKKAGELWKEMSPEAKKKYEEENARLKEKYDEAMVEYKKNLKDNPPPSSSPSGSAKKSKKASKKSSASSPQKDTKAGSGTNYKSKEYIESDNSSDTDSDDKPLKPKEKKKTRSSKKEEGDSPSDASLPSDHEEDVLSSPEHSGKSADEGGDETGSGSGSGSDSGSE